MEELFGADLRSLAAFRISIALLIIIDLINRSTDLAAHYTDLGVLPRVAAISTLPNVWSLSLHFMNGTPQLQAVLFLIAGLFAVALLCGYRTQLVTFVSWALLISLRTRNPLVSHGSDILLGMLLFWSIFLPLGARYSFDSALNPSPQKLPERILSIGTVALFAQILFMYWFTAVHKSGVEWWHEGSAVYYALNHGRLAKPLGLFLLNFPLLLKFLTHSVLWFEVVGPLMLFIPVFRGPTRTAVVFAFFCLQLGFGLCLDLGLFPWISSVAMLPFVPTWFWDKLFMRLRTPARLGIKIYYDRECGFCKKMVLFMQTFFLLPETPILPAQDDPSIQADLKAQNSWVLVDQKGGRHFKFKAVIVACRVSPLLWPLAPILEWRLIARGGKALYEKIASNRTLGSKITAPFASRPLALRPSRLASILAAFFLVYVFFWLLGTVKDSKYKIPEQLEWIGTMLRIKQKWAMFAPSPPKFSGWYVIPGRLKNGTQIDLWKDGGSVSWEKSAPGSAPYKSRRWRRYIRQIRKEKNRGHRLYFAQYLCRQWNIHHEENKQLEELAIYYMREKTLPNYEAAEPKKILLWKQPCFKEGSE